MLKGLGSSGKILAVFFQSVSTRTAGFNAVNLALLSPTSAFVFCVCMWISVSPVVAVMRSTTRSPEQDHSQSVGRRQQDRGKILDQLSGFMHQYSLTLLGLFFVTLVAELWRTDEDAVRANFLPLIFEFCSAYGTVGLSMSGQTDTSNFSSAELAATAKLCFITVMFLGRLRGLPESIDPAFRLEPLEPVWEQDEWEQDEEENEAAPPLLEAEALDTRHLGRE
mmetsp:Transcript_26928/g.84544  ORF Transcript_26928/g.84544 Transcript_26928/m.84544 type:complete len:223 (-) Transcript_26928:48-716(-)